MGAHRKTKLNTPRADKLVAQHPHRWTWQNRVQFSDAPGVVTDILRCVTCGDYTTRTVR